MRRWLLVAVASACSFHPPRQAMVASDENPAGEGTVSAQAGSSANTELEVRVKHLADPQRLATDASVYVVWVTPRNGPPQNAGAMELANDRAAVFSAITPHRVFTLTITPEPGPRMIAPTHKPVFTAEITRAE